MKVTHKIIAWLAGAVLLVALGVVVSFLTYSQIEESAAMRKHTNAVLDGAEELLSALRDAETGQRGYLLTGDKAFLEPYLAVRDRISGQLVELRRLTLVSAAQERLDALAPLVDAKLADMSHAIELRRNHDVTAALASVRGGQGRQLMDAIRAEMGGVIQIEQGVLAQRETEFQASMRQLFTVIVATTLLTLMFALAFAWLIYRESQQRIKNLVHLETQRLLDNQRDTNKQLQQTNAALQGSKDALRKAAPLQSAIFNSANFSSIATDAKGVIQIFNVGAERMLGYAAADVMNKITPADISDPQEVIARAKALSAELGTPITPGFEALVFKAARGIEDIYELTYIRKDGSRFPAIVSVTALRDAEDTIIGYLLIGTDNTARKQAEEALLKAGALQKAIFDSANFSSIATDAKGVIQIFNVGAERMLGYAAADVMNKITPAEISDPQEVIARAKALSAELGTPITPGFEALVFKASRGIEDIYELTYIRKDGSRFPAVVSVTALRDAEDEIIGYLLIGTDNTARKQAEEALLKAGALQTAIFNSANFSSIATDAKGVIQIFNVGAERMLGYAAADVMNKITPADISDPQEVIARAKALSAELGTPITPGFEALVFKASRGIEDIYELTYIRKDGSRFPAVVSVTALRDAQGAIIGYLLIGTDNTARKRVEAEQQRLLKIQEETHKQLQQTNATLQVSEEKLTVTLNSIGDAVIATDAEARVTFLNPIAEQLTGWTQAQASGHPVDEIFHIINQETRQPATIPVMETLAHGTVQGLANHTVLIARNGSECAIADSCAPIRDRDGQVIGAVLVFRDVTREYAVQQALRDSTALIQTMLNTVVDGIITIHARGGIVETVNPAAEKMFGYSAAELIGQNFSLLIPELDRDQRSGSLEYYSASDEARAMGLGREVVGRRKDGSMFPMEMAVSEMWLGNQRYFTGILRDTTMRKQVEAERAQLDRALQDKNVELESARFVAEKANLAKSVFLSRMSHELRTPLNAILGFAQLLEGGSPAPTAAQIVRLHQIIKAGWYLLELINEILDLALIESGKLSLSREPVSLIDVMRECQAMIEPQAQKHDIHISFLPFDKTWFAHADRTRVKQVLINLLSNAIKYNRKHGTVEVKCTGTPERIRISIRDSGMGLPPEKLLQLFQPFNRLGQESGTEEGTGIGLVVTKQLVELMGGTVGVTSTVGVGSEFWIELIRDFTTQQPATGNIMPAELVPQAHGDAARHTLLYVEDNPANLLLVEQIIQDHPHVSMLSARDGNLGVALARAHLPDVILMDINLPGISGIEAMNILRQDPATAHIPVIALSANAMLRDIEKGLEAGFFRYLTKPIKVNEFMNALDDALKFAETGKFSEKELVNTNETGQKP